MDVLRHVTQLLPLRRPALAGAGVDKQDEGVAGRGHGAPELSDAGVNVVSLLHRRYFSRVAMSAARRRAKDAIEK